jgi:Flp pilus assembly protein TadD
MRLLYSVSFLFLLAACSENGGALPIDAKGFLDKLDGPKISTVQETQLEDAKNAEKKGNFSQAIQTYQQILEKDGSNKDVVLALADALRRNGEYEKAIVGYDDLIKKDAGNIAAKEGKGLALISKGDFETPTDMFLDILKVDGKRWKSLNAVGILFATRSLYPESQKYFEEALRQNPNNISVMNNLGLVQALNKNFSASVETLSKTSAQSAVDSLARKRIDLNLAMIYASMGKLDEAEKIARIYLNGAQLDNNLGLYAHLAKDDQLAKSYLNMALTENTVYYAKAWDNLETLTGAGDNKNKAKVLESKPIETTPVATPQKIEQKTKKRTKKTIAANSEPVAAATSSEPVNPAPVTPVPAQIQSLGTIKSSDLK